MKTKQNSKTEPLRYTALAILLGCTLAISACSGSLKTHADPSSIITPPDNGGIPGGQNPGGGKNPDDGKDPGKNPGNGKDPIDDPSGQRSGLLAPSLDNVGSAVDNVLPLGLADTGRQLGETLDTLVVPLSDDVTSLTQGLGDSTGLGEPINALLGGLGTVLADAGGQLDQTVPLGLGGTLQHLGQAVNSAGGLLQSGEDNTNPLGDTLNHVTLAVASLTAPLGGENGLLGGLTGGLGGDANNGGLLAPVTNLLGGLTGGLGGDAANGGLLAPVTGLLSGVTGGLGGEAANGGLLAPVTGLLGGVTGGLTGGNAANGGLLAPVTNLLGGVTGSLSGGDAANGGLLAPVTGLLGGVTGSLQGGDSTNDNAGSSNQGLLSPVTGLLGGLLGGGK